MKTDIINLYSRYSRSNIIENQCYVKEKQCCACGYFEWVLGSIGSCEAKKGKCEDIGRFKDYSDNCDCGKFIEKRIPGINECPYCGEWYEDDDYAYLFETGSCQYCHELILEDK